MNRANLNQVTFSRYMSICRQRQLLVETSGGYALTPQAEELLHSINRVLSRATELQIAVDVLNQTARSGGYRLPAPEIAVRRFDRASLSEPLTQLPTPDRRAPLVHED